MGTSLRHAAGLLLLALLTGGAALQAQDRPQERLVRYAIRFPGAELTDEVQGQLLAILGVEPDPDGRQQRPRAPQVLRSAPILVVDLDRRQARVLAGLRGEVQLQGQVLSFTYEPVPLLSESSARSDPHPADVSMEQLLAEVRSKAAELTGEGWRVVLIDSGFDDTCPTVGTECIDAAVVSGSSASCPVPIPVVTTPEAARNPAAAASGFDWTNPDHGTKVAAVLSRLAPEAELVAIRAGEYGSLYATDIVAALEEISCLWQEKHPPLAAVVVTASSLEVTRASHEITFDAMRSAVDELWQLRIPVVAAAGNDGKFGQVAFPASVEGTISVAGVSDTFLGPGGQTNWSAEIDLCAPGQEIPLKLLEVLPSTPLEPLQWSSSLTTVDGTSFAVPFVAGAIVQLRQACPAADPGSILEALRRSSRLISYQPWWSPQAVELPMIQIEEALAHLRPQCSAGAAPGESRGEVDQVGR